MVRTICDTCSYRAIKVDMYFIEKRDDGIEIWQCPNCKKIEEY